MLDWFSKQLITWWSTELIDWYGDWWVIDFFGELIVHCFLVGFAQFIDVDYKGQDADLRAVEAGSKQGTEGPPSSQFISLLLFWVHLYVFSDLLFMINF